MLNYPTFKSKWCCPSSNGDVNHTGLWRIDYDRVYLYQCVDLILEFIYAVAGVASGVSGNAIDYANKPSAAFVNATVKVTDGSKQAGDILVFKGITDPDGHIAIRDTDVDRMLEQNGFDGNGSGFGKDAIGIYRAIPYDRLVAVYRLKVLISAPAAAAAPTPAVAPVTGNLAGKKLFLPSAGGYWRVYPLAGPYTPGHEVGKLWPGNPAWAPGLTYDILGVVAANVIKIHTSSYGDVAIYVGGDTPAQFVTDTPAPAAPAPAAPTPPAPAKTANIVYTKLEAPLSLVVNKQPTNVWGLNFNVEANATSTAEISKGTAFMAYGKAQFTNGDKPCYYMTEADFGQADTTGIPAVNQGVNTVDLSLAPAPTLTITDNSGPATPAPAVAEDNKVAVNVIPTDPNAWKKIDTRVAGEYTAKTSLQVYDLEGGGEPQQLIRGQTVIVGGKFTKVGVEYYITKKSIEAGLWFGIPTIALAEETLDADNDLFDLDIADELKNEMAPVTLREKAIAKAAISDAKKIHLPNPFKKKK